MASAMIDDGYDAAIFVDNDEKHIEEIKNCQDGIYAYKVPGVQGRPVPVFLDDPTLQPIVADLSQPTILPFLKEVHSLNRQGDLFDKDSGIQETHRDEILAWADSQIAEGKRKIAAIFDFDRTLTVFEGMYAFTDDGKAFDGAFAFLMKVLRNEDLVRRMIENYKPQPYMEYLCGGVRRLAMLQGMMDELNRRGVDIFILTNNATCVLKPLFMKQLIHVILRRIPYRMICSASYSGRKNLALKAMPRFSLLCKASGGGRRRQKKTRRSKKRSGTRRSSRR